MDDFNLFDKKEDGELGEVKETVSEGIKEVEEKISITDIDKSERHKEIDEEEKISDIGKDSVIEGSYIDVTETKEEVVNNEQLDTTKTSYYSETIINEDKPKNNNSSFKRLIAGILIVSLVGGPMIGFGIGIAKPFSEKVIIPAVMKINDKIENNETKFSFKQNNDTISTTQVSTNLETTTVSPGVGIYKSVAPSVVGITSTLQMTDFFNRGYDGQSSGSGIIFNSTDDKIYIVTNNHVIQNATKVAVTLFDNKIVEASLVGADSQTDLAVIYINKADMEQETINNIAVARFGDSSKLEIGEIAIAIGNPLGQTFSSSMSQGIISGLDRQVQVEDRNLTVIQTDAAINPGNSGGALVSSKGEVIGINTIKVTDSEVEGMGFAIPTNIAKPIIEELMKKGYISRPQLGITGIDITEQLSELYQLPIGVYIAKVVQGSSAHIGGIQAGDIIIEFDGEKIISMEQLTQLIKKHSVDDKIQIKVVRNGKSQHNLSVVLQDSNSRNQQSNTQQNQQFNFNPFGN